MRDELLKAAIQTAVWIDKYSHTKSDTKWWDVLPGIDLPEDAFLLKNTSIYAGAAGVALFYLRLYASTNDEAYLENAKAGINFCISKYRGQEEFKTDSDYLRGTVIGFLNGACGGAYVSSLLYQVTGEKKYMDYAIRVSDDLLSVATEDGDKLYWYGEYGIIGEGSLILYLIDSYERYGDERYLKAAIKGARYISSKKEESPWGGYRWYVMPTDTFPTIRKAGGYFPGFEYGAAGCGYILTKVYEKSGEKEFLDVAKGAAEYIMAIADVKKDGVLVRYNDTYLTDLYYLGVCQGPVGTSRLFYALYENTKEPVYKDFLLKLTRGLINSKAPLIHSRGYWRTDCYCCGGAGMLEHYVNIYRLTKDKEYLELAYNAAESVIGESTEEGNTRRWYTAWNRHEPHTSDAYVGLYHGSAGNASALLYLRDCIESDKIKLPYLEDAYKTFNI